jgi:hypothetical protein
MKSKGPRDAEAGEELPLLKERPKYDADMVARFEHRQKIANVKERDDMCWCLLFNPFYLSVVFCVIYFNIYVPTLSLSHTRINK